jgi:hypothetical protein
MSPSWNPPGCDFLIAKVHQEAGQDLAGSVETWQLLPLNQLPSLGNYQPIPQQWQGTITPKGVKSQPVCGSFISFKVRHM